MLLINFFARYMVPLPLPLRIIFFLELIYHTRTCCHCQRILYISTHSDTKGISIFSWKI